MSEPFIKIEELSYLYEDSAENSAPALRQLSLEINSGEFVAILGHNGSGKSTLAKLLSMILVSTSGKIIIDGKDITSEELTEKKSPARYSGPYMLRCDYARRDNICQ